MHDVAKGHQMKIAKSTLKMSDIGARIMGGMSKAEARKFIKDNCSPAQARKIFTECEEDLTFLEN